ncbi:MAG: hypothetical protein D6693_08045 [Planctomycetota bacterium]|nr:MAG: hypothetical protein D6693_08045 [Planctomycetota bacterium]
MSRRPDRIRAAALALAALASLAAPAPAPAQATADEALESFLEARGLDGLLARQLRDRLTRTPAPERAPIAERLADLYGRLIENAQAEPDRARWERAARDMLSALPEGASMSLRLSLERARYANAERTLERARLRLADAREAEAALADLADLAPLFDAIGRAAHERVLAIRRQEESGRPFDAALLAEALADARRDRSLAFYLAGWSNVYLAESAGARGRARDALPQFGWLLGANLDEAPQIDRVPARTLRLEHVGRSAIGVGLAHAALGDPDAALAWLDLVERADGSSPAVREQARARRLIVLAGAGLWGDAEALARSMRRDAGGTLEPTIARLAAVLALEGADTGRGPRDRLARLAVADLIERGEIGQVVDLASKFGAGRVATGDDFVGRFVRGLVAYDAARRAHRALGGEALAPTADDATVRRYRQAAELLRGALADEAGAEAHPSSSATAATLAGSALYLASGADPALAGQAVAWLRRGAERQLDPARAADAMWLAYRAARRAAGDPDRDGLVLDVASAFLDAFPDDRRADVLRVQLAATGGLGPEDAVAALLDTPRDSPAYETARRHAARLLYDLYRSAPTQERDWAALRYAEVAEPLLAIDRQRASRGDAAAAQRAVVRARRLLDALLSVSAPDAGRASAALAALDAVAATGLADAPPEGEVLLRRAQLALASGSPAQADRHVEALAALARRDASSAEHLAYAKRAVFDDAVRAFRAATARTTDPTGVIDAARRVIAAGADALRADGDGTDAQSLAQHAAIAEAAEALWRATGDERALELALARRRLILDARPGERRSLRSLADLAEARGDLDAALDAWRTLSAGLAPESDGWFEARVRLMELLERADPSRAAVVLRQHLALHGLSAPAPWRDRLARLADRLGVETPGGGAPP